MTKTLKRRNDINRVRRELKNRLLQMGFARASHNYEEVSSIISSMQSEVLFIQRTDIQNLLVDIQALIHPYKTKTPIFDETRLDDLTHLLQSAIDDI